MFREIRTVVSVLLVIGFIHMSESLYRQRTAPTLCDTPTIKNGKVRMRQRGRFTRYECDKTYRLHGDRYSGCQSGRWENPVPICIKRGCAPFPNVDHGTIALLHNNASALLFCKPGYSIAGSNVAFCDGRQWDRSIGSCREDGISTEKFCDFETDLLCGWANDPNNAFDWKRRAGYGLSTHLRTGPKHDHTVKIPLEGNYMVAELTNVLPNDAARFISPIYNATSSKDACFRFFYHIFGLSAGTLRVYIKPVTVDLDDMLEEPSYMLFQIQGSHGNQWKEAFFIIEELKEDFQFIMEASGKRVRLNDIAIDDVALLNGGECIEEVTMIGTEKNEEDGGIYDIQTCMNRCNETTPAITTDRTVTLTPNGKKAIIEQCDCHLECIDSKSCCLDYSTHCIYSDDEETTVSSEHTEWRSPLTTSSSPSSTPMAIVVSTAASTSTSYAIIRKTKNSLTIPATTSPPKLVVLLTTQVEFVPASNITTISSKRIFSEASTTEYKKTTTVKTTTLLRTTQLNNLRWSTSKKPAKSSPSSNPHVVDNDSMSVIKIILICIFMSSILLLGTMTLWKVCIPIIWMKVRRNPLDYKTKYYSKEATILSINDEPVDDEREPIDGKQLNDVAPKKLRPEKLNRAKLSDYSDHRLLSDDDEEQLDFTLQEC